MTTPTQQKEGGALWNELRSLISMIDELRDMGLQQYIKLPRIAVLGTQSSGKSSVLENIVGLDFLPRGDGVVTRRPLEMRLNHSSENIVPWAEFEEVPNKKFTNFEEVRDTITLLTDKVCGKSYNIIDKPIVLKIYSYTCPDLTLIDLPGITRIPLKGSDQPENIEEITKSMCLRYVHDYRTIILCVIPANIDLTTSEALQIAKKEDQKMIRTIGVITKIDLMDSGTNCKKALLGEEVPMRLGFVGIVNRSQQDIINNVKVRRAIDKEKEYFSTHPVYGLLPPEVYSTESLTKKLTKVMHAHIRSSVPDILREIEEKMAEVVSRLTELGPPLPSKDEEKMQHLWMLTTDFTQKFKNKIACKHDYDRKTSTISNQLEGGAKIKYLFYKLFRDFKDENYKATKRYTNVEIERAITLHEGNCISGFPSVDVFSFLINPELEKIREPSIHCLNEIYDYLESLTQQIIEHSFSKFPDLSNIIYESVQAIILSAKEKTKILVEALIESELSYMFTSDKNYLETRTSFIPQLSEEEKAEISKEIDNDNVDSQKKINKEIEIKKKEQLKQLDLLQNMKDKELYVIELRKRIDTYFHIVIRNIRDQIPKIIGFFLVKGSQDRLQFELYNNVVNTPGILKSIGEAPRITEERNTMINAKQTLENSIKVMKRNLENIVMDEDEEEIFYEIEKARKEKESEAKEKESGKHKTKEKKPSAIEIANEIKNTKEKPEQIIEKKEVAPKKEEAATIIPISNPIPQEEIKQKSIVKEVPIAQEVKEVKPIVEEPTFKKPMVEVKPPIKEPDKEVKQPDHPKEKTVKSKKGTQKSNLFGP